MPDTRSVTPSPSKSPMDATDLPKLSLSAKTGPFGVVPLISEVLFTVPSAFISMMYTVSVWDEPAARSVTPSPSKSPMDATDVPKSL